MKSSNPCLLDFPALPDEAFEGHIVPIITHISLVSIGKLCDAGYTSVLKSQEFTIKLNDKIVIQRPRDRRNGLWKIPLTFQIITWSTLPQEEYSNNENKTS